MSVIDDVRESESLGRDFQVWLWFRSETMAGSFQLQDGEEAELWFEGKLTLQSEGDRGVETVVCTGENVRIREARFALGEGKKPTSAKIHLRAGDDEWVFELDSKWMNFHSLKTPGVFREKGEDPEALFYERVLLVEKLLSMMDQIFAEYVEARLSPTWDTEELPALMNWIREGMK
jgi:hypothetical protein